MAHPQRSMPLAATAAALAATAAVFAACGDSNAPDGAPLRLAELAAPDVSSGPAVRWWWPGGAVTPEELEREIGVIAEAGFGAVEVQAFDAALDRTLGEQFRARVTDVRSARYTASVDAMMRAAAEHRVAVDLTIGSGWPVGGTHVPESEASTTLMWWERTVAGPTALEARPTPQPTVFYTVADIAEASFGEKLGRFLPELAVPVAAFAGRIVEGRRDPSPLVLDDTVRLEPQSVVNLTDRIAPDGMIRWDVPSGRWHVVVVFAGPAGDYITLTAEPGDPFAVDHLDAGAVRRAVDGWFPDTARWPALRAVFSDSLEFKVDRLYTDDLLDEFAARRGYALDERILTVLSQSADSFLLDAGRVAVAPEIALGPDDDRVRWDYRQTVSELFVERFVGELGAWAAERGLEFRSQSYGIDVDVIEALGAAHVPETETLYAGGSRLFLKMASSAAHIHGRRRVSAEAFSFILRDHMTTPLKVRAAADVMFGAGVNQLVFHGFPYDAEGRYGLPGWTPFSSPFGGASTFASTFGERWEFFEWLPDITRYVARMQTVLLEGEPGADLLVVYPFLGFPTSLALAESHAEPLLGGHLPEAEVPSRDVPFAELAALLGPPVDDPRVVWLEAVSDALAGLESCGWTWSWINPASLSEVRVDDGALRVGDGRYGALVVLDTARLPVGAAEALGAISSEGARVLFAGDRPVESPSFAERAHDADVVAGVTEALAGPRTTVVDTVAELGVALADDLPRAATACGGAQRVTWRRAGAELATAFVYNPVGAPSSQSWTFAGCDRGVVYDAWSHRARPFDGVVRLGPYGSAVVACDADGRDVPMWTTGDGVVVPVAQWSLDVARATDPTDIVTAAAPVLGDWRDKPELAGRSGVGAYAGTVELQSAPGTATLRAAWVHGVATVTVNGTTVGDMVVPPWEVDVSGALREGRNDIAIRLVPPLRNELVALGESGSPEYAQFAGKTGTEVASGLVGPVELVVTDP